MSQFEGKKEDEEGGGEEGGEEVVGGGGEEGGGRMRRRRGEKEISLVLVTFLDFPFFFLKQILRFRNDRKYIIK